jgi:hypothetical protein
VSVDEGSALGSLPERVRSLAEYAGAMATLLDRAISEISKLPKRQRDRIARWLLEEITSERQWEGAFDGSADTLDRLAAEALDEHRRGRSKPLDPRRL